MLSPPQRCPRSSSHSSTAATSSLRTLTVVTGPPYRTHLRAPGKSDPYCKIIVGRKTEKSKRKNATLNPDVRSSVEACGSL